MKRRWFLGIATLLLMIPLLAACGSGDDDDDSDSGSTSGEPTATATASDSGTTGEATEATGEATSAATESSGAGTAEATESSATSAATESSGTGTAEATESSATSAATESSGEGTAAATEADLGSNADHSDVTVKIGSKNFTEELILGEMYAQLLEEHGYDVERSLNLGGTAVAHQALTSGEIDMYPEYTGTGLLAILEKETMSDPDEVYQVVSDAYKKQFNLVWLDQAPMNNSNALAVSREFSEENNLTTISGLVDMASDITLVAVPDFPERPDGLPGLKEVYGDFEFNDVLLVDPGIKYQAFLDGKANAVYAFGTDGQIDGYDLVVLEDDKGLWPPYHVAPVIRQEKLDESPDIGNILNELAPLLTSDVMRDLNWQVDGPDKMDPADVAHNFLAENGLIEE